MLNPGCALGFAGLVESGTKLAVWEQVEHSVPQKIAASKVLVSVPLKDIEEWRAVEKAWKELPGNVRTERVRRRAYLRREIEHDPQIPVWVWVIGDAVLVAFPHEAYSQIQQRLRATFKKRGRVCKSYEWGGYRVPTCSPRLRLARYLSMLANTVRARRT